MHPEKLEKDGSVTQYPSQMEFQYIIESGSEYGSFTGSNSGGWWINTTNPAKFIANENIAAEPVTVTISGMPAEWNTLGDCEEPRGSLVITKQQQLCPVVSIVPPKIKAGETAEVIVKGKKEGSETLEDYPEGTQFTFTITNGAEYGTVIGNTSPAQFKANEDIVFPEGVDEVNVTIIATVGGGMNAKKNGKPSSSHAVNALACYVGGILKIKEDWCKKFFSCGEHIPDLQIFQNVVEQPVESDWINGGRTSILPLNEETDFLNITPCCDKPNDCFSLKILGVNARVRVLVGTQGGKKIYSENDILESEKAGALAELETLKDRLEDVIENLDKFKGDITQLTDAEYSRLFQLPPVGEFNFVGAVRVHENMHREYYYRYIRKTYNEAVKKIVTDVGCKSADSFQGMSLGQIKEALKMYEIQRNFRDQMQKIPPKKIRETEQNAHKAQMEEIQRLINVLGGK